MAWAFSFHLYHSPFTFTLHREKASSYIDIAMGNDNYLPIWILWGRISLRFEIQRGITWGIRFLLVTHKRRSYFLVLQMKVLEVCKIH